MRKLVIATALAVATAGLATVAGPAQAGVPWLVTIKADATQVTLGQTVTFTGKVTPSGKAAGLKVVLQEKHVGKPWKDQAIRKVNAKGGYRVIDTPTTNTVRKYRVIMPGTNAHAKGVSSAVTVKVYGWSRLADRGYVNANQMYPQASVDLNGKAYSKSIDATSTGAVSIEYNLDHRCISLKGTFGIDDNSETGAQATVSAVSDGTQVYTHTFALGETVTQTIPLTAPLKLKLTAESVVSGADGYGAIGTPRILCTR